METDQEPQTNDPNKEKRVEPEKEVRDQRIQFVCKICGLAELTKFGKLEHKTVSTTEEVFYIPDPFVPFDIHKTDFRISDFVIFGAPCTICKLPVCVSKTCSIFYNNTFCMHCVEREQNSFPKEIINDLSKRFSTAQQIPVKPTSEPQPTTQTSENP